MHDQTDLLGEDSGGVSICLCFCAHAIVPSTRRLYDSIMGHVPFACHTSSGSRLVSPRKGAAVAGSTQSAGKPAHVHIRVHNTHSEGSTAHLSELNIERSLPFHRPLCTLSTPNSLARDSQTATVRLTYCYDCQYDCHCYCYCYCRCSSEKWAQR